MKSILSKLVFIIIILVNLISGVALAQNISNVDILKNIVEKVEGEYVQVEVQMERHICEDDLKEYINTDIEVGKKYFIEIDEVIVNMRVLSYKNRQYMARINIELDMTSDDTELSYMVLGKILEYKEQDEIKISAKVDLENDFSIEEYNKTIIKYLNSLGLSGLDTVKISNGYSNVIQELQIVVCEYDTGKYLYLGTPEILLSY